MKNIELTEKHKSKLLEICKVLFPEYTNIYTGQNNYDDKFDGYICFEKTIPLISNIINEIHWFEFCVTKLAPKICKSDGIAFSFSDGEYNPINFLYEEFEKLK